MSTLDPPILLYLNPFAEKGGHGLSQVVLARTRTRDEQVVR